MHRLTEFGEGVGGGLVGGAGFQAALRALEALGQGAVFVGVAELAEEEADLVDETAGFLD